MSKINSVRFVWCLVLAAIVNAPSAFAKVEAVSDQPAGWSVSSASIDPTLATLTEDQLVDRLFDTEPIRWNRPEPIHPFWAIGGVVNLGGGSENVPVGSPAAVELVRRGWRALPVLLDHLTDARPTKLVYAVPRPVAGHQARLAFGDEYDPRVRGTVNTPSGVNTGGRMPLDDQGAYTFRIGELCYAILGQIVNRDLRAVRCGGEDVVIFSGMRSSNPGDWFKTINSPIIRPALAAAARADWGGITAQGHVDSLRADFLQPVPEPAKLSPLRARASAEGALLRTLYYYPSAGLELAEARLCLRLIEPMVGSTGRSAPDENTADLWEQARFVPTLAPFHADRLQVALLDLFRRAAVLAELDLRKQPTGTWDPRVPSLGSDLALQCAKQLIHQGHDDELKAFFAARVAAIELATKGADPVSGKIFGSANLVNRIQAEQCLKFLDQLSGVAAPVAGSTTGVKPSVVRAAPWVRLGPVQVERRARSMQQASVIVRVSPIEPAPERIFVGRVIVDQAKDDVGVTLLQDYVPVLAPTAVGRSSEDEMQGLPKAAFEAELTRAAPQAKTLVGIEGRVELVVPDLDPDAVVVVKDIATKFGTTIESKALRAANISIAIHNRETAGGATIKLATANEAAYGEMARSANQHMSPSGYEAGDVALSISDPDGRFLNVEFRDVTGHSLHYNHNGWSHSSSGLTRFDVYRIGDQIPAGTQMVVWLMTSKSLLVVPLNATNLPLPEEAASVR